jgi:hypothetical protein
MTARTQITMDPETQRRAQAKAAELGISFAEYVRRLVADDLGAPQPKADIASLFGLIDEGPPTNIARDKDKMIGEAVWQEHLRKTGRLRKRARPRAKRRR